MKKIKLTQGKYALVDDEDFKELNKIKWHVVRSKKNDDRYFYAMTSPWVDGRSKHVRMHRIIMNHPKDMLVHHKDHNGLNNQKRNLQVCSISENLKHQQKRKNREYKGVHYKKDSMRWRAQIMSDGKLVYLGTFKTAKAAALSYDEAARKYHKRFALTNF